MRIGKQVKKALYMYSYGSSDYWVYKQTGVSKRRRKIGFKRVLDRARKNRAVMKAITFGERYAGRGQST